MISDSTPKTILIAEEDPATRIFLADNLTADGYRVKVADTTAKALALLQVDPPDLMVVDVNGETLALLDAVRGAERAESRIDPDTPVIALSAEASELHRVRLLERGGDDVVAKPFSYLELRGRIGALLRRTHGSRGDGMVRVGDLTIDPAARRVRVGERDVELTGKEFALLCHLAAEPRRVFTKAELLREVWGFRSLGQTRTIDSHACRLRRKLGVGGGRYVVNVWGVGYALVDSAPG